MIVDKSRTLLHTDIVISEQDGYEFSAEKNNILIEKRRIGFKDVIVAIHNGKVLEVINHHNQTRYPNQKVYVVDINHYICEVPFVRTDRDTIFLKTIFRSRKLTKKYLCGKTVGEKHANEE